MYYRDTAARFRLLQAPLVPASVYDLLVGLKGRACHIALRETSLGGAPAACWTGFLAEISPAGIAMGVAAELGAVPAGFGCRIETMTAGAVIRFQAQAQRYDPVGHLELTLPNQVETIQRRQFARIPVHVPVAYTDQQGTAGGIGHTVDLAVGGMQFETQAPVEPGARMYLSFQLPDGPALRGLGAQVIRLEGRGVRHTIAVRFESPSPEQTEALVQGVMKLTVNARLRGY